MNMRDASTGEMLWEMNSWPSDWHVAEIQARVPARILQCAAVSRELTFSSVEKVANLRCEHRVYLDGAPDPIEVWDFDFGFVMPGSRNTWQTTVEAAVKRRCFRPTEARVGADGANKVHRRRRPRRERGASLLATE